MIDELIDRDIEVLMEQLLNGDYFLIDAILRGDCGWKQYSYLTDEEIRIEYYDLCSCR